METKTDRMYGLDLLRCILMLIGPIIHTGQLFNADFNLMPLSNRTIENFTFLTHSFRMDLFFFISGFFTSLVLEKKGIAYFRRSRTSSLYIPSAFSLLTILPVTNILYIYFSKGETFHFHHLWFLIVLGGISLYPYFAPRLYSRLSEFLSQLKVYKILVLFVVLYLVNWGLRNAFFKWIAFDNPIAKETFALLLFLPLLYFLPFVFGSAIYKKALLLTITKFQLAGSMIIYILVYWLSTAFPYEGDLYAKGLGLIAQLLLMVSAIALSICLFFFCMNLNLKPTKLLAFVTKSALTFYLIHQPFVFLFAILIKDKLNNAYFTFFVICLLTYIFSFGFYYCCRKNRYLRKVLGISDTIKAKPQIT